MTVRGHLSYLGSLAAGGGWRRCLREIYASPPDQIRAQYTEALLRHASTRVPYYEGLALESRDFESFPILTRHTLRDRFADLQSRDLQPNGCSKTYTGGSTGQPVWVLQDRTFQHWFNATDMYYLAELVGISCVEYLSHPRVVVWHQRPSSQASLSARRMIAHLLDQVVFLETNVGMGDDTLLSYLHEINRARPLVIVGTSSYLYELARLAKRKNVRVHHPRVILASAEMLYPQMRELLQEVFGCPVRERYGAVEAGRVAGECQRGNLHVFSFACCVEVLDSDNRPTPPGEEGRVIVTPLHNPVMPLIRYDIGDMALRPTAECSCGSSLPVLGTIRGRVADHFVTADGQVVFGGYFVAMFYDHPWISEFQVLQEDLDRVTVFYRTMPGDTAPPGAIEALTRVIREAMGRSCRVRWEEVDEVPRTPLGKHLHIRSLVWQERVKNSGQQIGVTEQPDDLIGSGLAFPKSRIGPSGSN